MIVILFVMLFTLIGLGFDIWASMGISGMLYILIRGQFSLNVLASTMVGGVDSSSLVAIPFFMLAGHLMNRSGITKKLADFAEYFIGRFKGGLAYVAIVVNVFMAGVSGSSVADASAVSSVMLPTMKERGYDKPFAASINAAAAVVGPIIPPSIPMIFIGVISEISIGRLFLGGLVPGLLMAAILAVAVGVTTRKKDFLVVRKKLTFATMMPILRDTFFALVAPAVIILGVVLGVVTIIEVAVLANFYILLISLFVYRTIRLKDLPSLFADAAVFSTAIMMIFAVVGLYQYIVASEQLGEKLVNLVASLHLTRFEFLLAINAFFLFMGLILDAVPVMLIFFPVLLPVATQMGIDPVHFGVITVMNLMIGLLTPPIGALLFLEAKIADLRFERLVSAVWPYTASLIAVLLLCTYVPQLVMFIPNLILGSGVAT